MTRQLSRRHLLTLTGAASALAIPSWALGPATAHADDWTPPRVTDCGWTQPPEHSGRWMAVVENANGNADIGRLRVMVRFLDGAGVVIGTDSQVLDRLPAGGRVAVASYLYLNTPGPVDRMECGIGEFEWLPDTPPTVSDARFVPGRFVSSVQGLLTNPYPRTLTRMPLVALCYDAGGQVVGIGSGGVESVPAGGSAAIDIDVAVTGTPASVELLPQW